LLLGKNPGYIPERSEYIRGRPEYQTLLRDNLLHRLSDYPFFPLDPALPAEGAVTWWTRKFRKLLSTPDSLRRLARSLLAVELFPYASRKFAHGKLLITSQDYSRWLVTEGIRREAVTVLTRGRKAWYRAIRELEDYGKRGGRLYVLRNKQNYTISKGNCPDAYPHIAAIIDNQP
jgi:hypothetical protein